MTDKPKMSYYVRTTQNTMKNETVYVPYIVNRKTLSLSQIVDFAPNTRTQAQKRLLFGRAASPRPPNVIERLSWEDSPTIINSCRHLQNTPLFEILFTSLPKNGGLGETALP